LSRKIKTQTRVFLISVYFPVPLLQTWQTTQGLQGDLSILLPWIFSTRPRWPIDVLRFFERLSQLISETRNNNEAGIGLGSYGKAE